MRAIVLAAGTGSRLGEVTKARTKGLVTVNEKPLIDYLMEFFEPNFFDEIIVVGGFCYEDLRNHLRMKNYPRVRVIENPDYLKGNIFTLLRALKEFDGDSFLITNVDHIYPRAMFEKMKPAFTGEITAMCDFDRTLGADDMKVKLRKGSRFIAAISKQLSEFDCGYIGMTYVDSTKELIYRDAVQKALERFGEKAVVENILQILAESEYPPAIHDLSGIGLSLIHI
ncbi:MAG: NTP transferase domain-containing protein, partial [Spirochaetes bacterium]|nr:NTP transferase domain-containing protein [Spirochaetota bacterium]